MTPAPRGSPQSSDGANVQLLISTPDREPLLAHPMFSFVYLKARVWFSSTKMILVFTLKKSLILLAENLEN